MNKQMLRALLILAFIPVASLPVSEAYATAPGDRVRCEIGLYASARTVGPQLAQVQFHVR